MVQGEGGERRRTRSGQECSKGSGRSAFRDLKTRGEDHISLVQGQEDGRQEGRLPSRTEASRSRGSSNGSFKKSGCATGRKNEEGSGERTDCVEKKK